MRKRRKFTAKQKLFIITRQQGRCDETGAEFMDGDVIEFDHRIPLALGGDDTLENLRAVLASAHLRKTKLDVWRIAKCKRQARLTGQQARRAAGKNRPIQSRGFDKTKTKTMDGRVVEKTNGKRIPSVRRDRRGLAEKVGAEA